jgi:hypothetical protein
MKRARTGCSCAPLFIADADSERGCATKGIFEIATGADAECEILFVGAEVEVERYR